MCFLRTVLENTEKTVLVFFGNSSYSMNLVRVFEISSLKRHITLFWCSMEIVLVLCIWFLFSKTVLENSSLKTPKTSFWCLGNCFCSMNLVPVFENENREYQFGVLCKSFLFYEFSVFYVFKEKKKRENQTCSSCF